jgi:hypothetical protein
MAGLELWGTARGRHAALIREIGASPIDYKREDFTRVLPDGFDVVFDGVGEDDYRRSFAALKPGGLLCAYGYTASVQAQRGLFSIVSLIVRQYLWRQLLSWLPFGKRLRVYSINLMRAQHECWRLAPSDRASLSGFPSTRWSRHTAVSKKAVLRASSSFARTCRRSTTVRLVSASQVQPTSHPRPQPGSECQLVKFARAPKNDGFGGDPALRWLPCRLRVKGHPPTHCRALTLALGLARRRDAEKGRTIFCGKP